MQYDLKKMKKEYDKKPISECVELIKKFNEELIQRGEALISLLWYLEKTKRYHEYDGYKNIAFKVFISEICHITYNRYRELVYAYNWFPKESREWGPQTIQTIRTKVGVTKIPSVLKDVKAAVSKIKDPEKRRNAIFQVIEKHSPPKPEKIAIDTKSYWRNKYDTKDKECIDLLRENKALKEQIKRLKETVVRLTNEIDIDEPERIPMQINA